MTGVCSLGAYKGWRNTLYKACYTDSLFQRDEQLLLTLEELGVLDQYVWEMVFAESSSGEISIVKAMARVSTSRRVSMELFPKTVFSASSRKAPDKRPSSEAPGNDPTLTERKGRN